MGYAFPKSSKQECDASITHPRARHLAWKRKYGRKIWVNVCIPEEIVISSTCSPTVVDGLCTDCGQNGINTVQKKFLPLTNLNLSGLTWKNTGHQKDTVTNGFGAMSGKNMAHVLAWIGSLTSLRL